MAPDDAQTIRRRVAYLGGYFSFVMSGLPRYRYEETSFPSERSWSTLAIFRTLPDPGDDVFCRALPTRWHA